MQTGLARSQFYSACYLEFHHYYEENGHRPPVLTGTGFLVKLPSNRTVLVTNRHLADMAWADEKYDGFSLEKVEITAWEPRGQSVRLALYPTEIWDHGDDSIDISVLLFDGAELVHPHGIRTVVGFALSLPFLQESAAQLNDMGPGQPLMFPGYPEWRDRAAGRPILRTGTISSDPLYPYRRLEGDPTHKDGNQSILFEAFSTSGNSGSPVFAENVPSFDGQSMVISAQNSSYLVGINAGHLVEREGGQVNHAGFSRLYRTSAILDIVQGL